MTINYPTGTSPSPNPTLNLCSLFVVVAVFEGVRCTLFRDFLSITNCVVKIDSESHFPGPDWSDIRVSIGHFTREFVKYEYEVTLCRIVVFSQNMSYI